MAKIINAVSTAIESAIDFGVQYGFVWIKASADCYVSAYSNIVAGADNVAELKAGECVMLTPVSRYIYAKGEATLECIGQNVPENPFMSAGGGGSEPVLITKTITANDTYDASDESADGYSSVTVNVPNSYTQADEGKVVDSGALVSQSSLTVTQNDTYDTTLKNSVTVNVPMHLIDYSTTEQSTCTTWIDGKTVYQKTFVNDSGYTSSDSIDISSLGFDKILYIDGFGADRAPYSNYSKWTIASIGGESNRYIYVDNYGVIHFGSTMPVFAVTIRYTKAV